ncbi:MAG: hypothetical protein ABSF15_03035 [Candidatus Sulfotelmatobacter sp.]|jgi:hypothetical protein
MNVATDRFRLKLRVLSDEELWCLLLCHPQECLQEFWKEVKTRKAAGRLAQNSPFWTMSELAAYGQPRYSGAGHSNLIEPTREEWEAHKRRKMFRVISA